ncbi:hypothetical protein [Haloplanus halophilus]|uniref:hypothetical protein n=1 Tax=Haloplanus halophilus TaxID=2949993 RepID=UPI0020403EA9|nr:hypothetical protein [Haloplanus sp. GDY1]
MTPCDNCGSRLRAGRVRVYIPERDHGAEVAIALCVGCSTRKPSDKLYTPTGISDRSRTDLSGRGRP